jgi:hypothetical protein
MNASEVRMVGGTGFGTMFVPVLAPLMTDTMLPFPVAVGFVVVGACVAAVAIRSHYDSTKDNGRP